MVSWLSSPKVLYSGVLYVDSGEAAGRRMVVWMTRTFIFFDPAEIQRDPCSNRLRYELPLEGIRVQMDKSKVVLSMFCRCGPDDLMRGDYTTEQVMRIERAREFFLADSDHAVVLRADELTELSPWWLKVIAWCASVLRAESAV